MIVPNYALYARPTDEIGHLATVVLASGTADLFYPVTNVQTFDPSQAFLTSSTGVVDIDFDFGSAAPVAYVSIHHHNLPAGTVGHIYQGASQGATTVDTPFTVATYAQTGLPLPIGIEVSEVSPATNYRWLRVHIPSVAQKVGFGSILVWSTIRQDLTNVRYPVQDSERQPASVFRTSYGVKRSRTLGVRLRRQPASFRFTTDAMYESFQTLFRACRGQANAFLWARDPQDSDPWLAGFEQDVLDKGLPYNRISDVTIAIEELACGKALPTV